MKTVTLRGKRWRLVEDQPLPRGVMGFCEAPNETHKRIFLSPKLKEGEKLEYLIHEALHGCLWDLDEEVIYEVAKDLATLLTRYGYQRKKGE